MFSSPCGPRPRHPLYCGLVAVVGGIVLAAALSLWGNHEIRQQLEAALPGLAGLCTRLPPPGAEAVCAAFAEAARGLRERSAVVALLQLLCFALIVAGAALLVRAGHRALVGRIEAAIALSPGAGERCGGDEIDRLAERLAELSARQAGCEREARWQRRIGTAQGQRDRRALQAVHQVAHTFCAGEVSEFAVRSALARIAAALGARTVALSLDEAACQALGSEAVLATQGAPALLRTLALRPGARETTARILPPAAAAAGPALVVPVWRGEAFVGTLVAEFAPGSGVDAAQRDLAESFAHVVALAISGLSHSREERRLALMEERAAIAAELHDSLAQSLGFMKIQVARLQRRLEGGEAAAEAAPLAQALREGLAAAYGDVRELISAFRARMEPGGLIATLQETVDDCAQRGSLDIGFSHAIERCHLEVNEEFHVVQVVREALANALRHAGARHLRVHAQYGPGHLFAITVDDDGCGLTAAPGGEGRHHGLNIMRERARALGGELAVAPGARGGTQVRLSFAPQRLPAPPPEDFAR